MWKTVGTILLVALIAMVGKALFRVYWKYEATHSGEVSAHEVDIDNKLFQLEQSCRTDKNNCMAAVREIKSICERDEARACQLLGSLYSAELIEGGRKKALTYYDKACDLGVIFTCSELGFWYGQGIGVRIDFKKAMEYYGKACDLGHEFGCIQHKELYLETNAR